MTREEYMALRVGSVIVEHQLDGRPKIITGFGPDRYVSTRPQHDQHPITRIHLDQLRKRYRLVK